MKKLSIILVLALFFGGCAGIRLVSDYDEVIDKGVTEFAEQFNTHVKNMGDLAGTQDGTYEANMKTYNALESKLDVMIARASAASEGKACKLEKQVFERVKKLLENKLPAELQTGDTIPDGNAEGCNERLLVLVREQLTLVEQIHRASDTCGERELSCLRPATVTSALKIANQSINAVSVVEAAKKH